MALLAPGPQLHTALAPHRRQWQAHSRPLCSIGSAPHLVGWHHLAHLGVLPSSRHQCPHPRPHNSLFIPQAQPEGSLSHNGASNASPLMSSLQLVWSRANETSKQSLSSQGSTQTPDQEHNVLLLDPYAQPLLDHLGLGVDVSCDELTHLTHVLASRYIDDTMLSAMAATSINTVNKGNYRQVVLVGDAFDSRPYRLPWPEGTLMFMVADRECHERATAAYKAIGARVPRGCLLKRVSADLSFQEVMGQDGSAELPSFLAALEAAGYQGNKLSVWALQGCGSQGLPLAGTQQLFTDITNGAAFNSLVLGEMPGLMTRKAAENLLADCGFLSTVLGPDHEAVSCGRWTVEHSQQLISRHATSADASTATLPWLFTAQQLRLSLTEMGIYEAHVAAAQETDEDFFGNFS